MSVQDDKAYYLRRAAEERKRHAEAEVPAIAAAHGQMALRYAELAAEDAEPYELQIVLEQL